jgi:hypothetical protein
MKLFLLFIAHFYCFLLYSQDTLFVRSIPLESPAKNIDTDGQTLFIRFEHSLYSWEDNDLSFIEEGKFSFSWITYDRSRDVIVVNHNNNIPAFKQKQARKVESLLPGKYNFYTTTATIGEYFYVCYNGKVLEFKVIPNAKRYHHGKSVRHVYTEPGLRIISTYDGVFKDSIWDSFTSDKLNSKLASYSNGAFVKIDSTYYLCQDNLIAYIRNTNEFKTIINTEGGPRFRKLIQFHNKVYGLYNSAFGVIDLITNQQDDFLIYDEFSDVIEFNDKLFLSSRNANLYTFNNDGNISKFIAPAPISDLAIFNDEIHIGTDRGLFVFRNGSFLPIISNVEVIQALAFNNNIIFSNNKGLNIFTEGEIMPLIEDVEFNKMALHQDQHYLYAGSFFGLYVIDNNFLENIEVSNTFSVEQSNHILISIIIVVLITVLVLVFLFIRQKQKGLEAYSDRKTVDVNSIRELVLNNPKILSVESLAFHLDTNVVQLNRYLKKEGLTSLALLKDIKKEIAIDMFKKGYSLKDIGKRVGYSERFVRSKFLSDFKISKK